MKRRSNKQQRIALLLFSTVLLMCVASPTTLADPPVDAENPESYVEDTQAQIPRSSEVMKLPAEAGKPYDIAGDTELYPIEDYEEDSAELTSEAEDSENVQGIESAYQAPAEVEPSQNTPSQTPRFLAVEAEDDESTQLEFHGFTDTAEVYACAPAGAFSGTETVYMIVEDTEVRLGLIAKEFSSSERIDPMLDVSISFCNESAQPVIPSEAVLITVVSDRIKAEGEMALVLSHKDNTDVERQSLNDALQQDVENGKVSFYIRESCIYSVMSVKRLLGATHFYEMALAITKHVEGPVTDESFQFHIVLSGTRSGIDVDYEIVNIDLGSESFWNEYFDDINAESDYTDDIRDIYELNEGYPHVNTLIYFDPYFLEDKYLPLHPEALISSDSASSTSRTLEIDVTLKAGQSIIFPSMTTRQPISCEVTEMASGKYIASYAGGFGSNANQEPNLPLSTGEHVLESGQMWDSPTLTVIAFTNTSTEEVPDIYTLPETGGVGLYSVAGCGVLLCAAWVAAMILWRRLLKTYKPG